MSNATDTQQLATTQDIEIASVELYDVAIALNKDGEIVDFDIQKYEVE